MVKVYGDLLSPSYRPVKAFISLTDISIEEEAVDVFALVSGQTDDYSFYEVNPHGQVPVLVDDDLTIAEGPAILQYLANKFERNDPWYPTDLYTRTAIDRVLHWSHLGLQQTVTLLFAKKVIFPSQGMEVPEAELAELEEGVPKTLETMDKWLNAHAFIATSEMTIADLVVYHLLAQAVMTIAIDLGRYPKLCAWYKLMAAMPENKATEFKIKGASARMNRPKIYGCFLSYNSNPLVGFCRATKVAYDYYELDPMTGEHKADWYKEIHPAGQFPALQEGNYYVQETIAILQYLAESKQVDDHWYPKDPKKRAKVDQFLSWSTLAFRQLHSMIWINRVLCPTFGWPVTDWKLQQADEALPKSLETIENRYLATTEYLGSDEVTICDVLTVFQFAQHQFMKIDWTPYPKIQAWYERVCAIPGIGDLIEENSNKFKAVQQSIALRDTR